ncbi:MAG TPA: 16S rRNA (guanine(527)-N(7))-methyltransferase RsmG [Dehalococcoidia bacterium]|nr:16S rRNA (guanine(527)-N(7))-methyltransferase RsmG [Dehalococcoidia bacterium]
MQTLADGARWLRLDLTPGQLQAFQTYTGLLLAERRRAALTSLTDPEALQRRHFLESLALLRALEDAGAFGASAIDIGAGAGFPGLPIKIARPALGLTLLEATGKKAAFLERLVRELDLSGVTVIHGRAEELAHDRGHRAAYDLALARAVAPLPTLVELALPFLRVGGYLAAPKGTSAPREVKEAAAALAACGGRLESLAPLRLPPGHGPVPVLVLVRKIADTPERLPRRAGIPAKRPLR